jgi:7-carboxy-7-deazaguanine synthase
MSYAVNEIFYSLQGEGANSGRPAVFCRFAGCNLWSGKKEDRKSAICSFCDTDFLSTIQKIQSAKALAAEISSHWGSKRTIHPFVVCTGGEPLLQMDDALVTALHKADFEIAIETNGTLLPPHGVDWICVSPKAGAELVLKSGSELKLIYPQEGISPQQFENLNFKFFFLQPMDGPDLERNTNLTLQYCLDHPMWRLSLQTHKILGIR